MTMTPADTRALKACVEIASREPMRERQIEQKRRAGASWKERARFCCSIVQSRTMALRPWEVPPADAVEEELHPSMRLDSYAREWTKAHSVVQRLIALGLSPYVADPLGEITRREEEQRLEQAARTPLRVVVSDGSEPPTASG
jgi:hypothetical protein